MGANIAGPHGPPIVAIGLALDRIANTLGAVVAGSRLYRSPAWPDPTDPEFVNAVAMIKTALPARALLDGLHRIEAEFGRLRLRSNAPRSLDLDLIDYGGHVSQPGDTLILPHPRMAHRAFVLLPLAEVAPDWRHPATGQTVSQLIAALPAPISALPISGATAMP